MDPALIKHQILTVIFPFKSAWTTENAAEPRRSTIADHVKKIESSELSRRTEQTNESPGCLQKLEGIDGGIGNRDVRKRLWINEYK